MLNLKIRITAIILCVLMLFTSFPVSATDTTEDTLPVSSPIEFSISKVKGVTDKDVHVEVRVSENSQIASLGLELVFDSSKLLVSNYSDGELFAAGMSAINGNVSDKVIASFVSMEPITSAGTLFSVDFKVTSEELNEKLALSLNVTEATDVNGTNLVSSATKGSVEVVDLLYGDLDLDNKITTTDALMILSAATEATTLTAEETKAADVNGDGEVSVSDALKVLYFTAEIIDDFDIYNISTPSNVEIKNLGEYEFTVNWDYQKDVLGYNVYFNGTQVNSELLTKASVTIGGDNGDASIAPRIHNSIDHNTEYEIQITAVNSLKESEKSETLVVKTKRAYSMVTFKDWDGTIIGKTTKILYGQDAIVPSDPVREGYVFIGWDKPTTNIIDDVVITALYEVARYDYIFNDYNGKELYRQNAVHGGTVTPPADPTRTGYTFVGWYNEAEGGTKITDFSNVVAENTVYAHYTINTYKVNYISQGSVITTGSAQYQSTTIQPTSPTRLGYGFDGWYKDSSCTNKWNFSTDKVLSETNLYAKWIPVVITIDKSNVTLNSINSTSQLKATITGGSDTLTWSSSNTSVATVSATGLITAKGHGTATIYVKGTSSERRPVTKVTVNIAKTAWVSGTGSSLKIRAQATTSSSIVGSLAEGAQITVYGELTAQGVSGQKGWYNVGNGWVSANYVVFTKPTLGKPFSGGYRITSHFNWAHGATDMIPTNGDKNLHALANGTVTAVFNGCSHHTNASKPLYKYDSNRGFGYRYCSHDNWIGGNYVTIKYDNGYTSTYAHVRSVSVSVGSRVSAGQVVGVMGNTGASTGEHLHFELKQNNTTVNPETVIGL